MNYCIYKIKLKYNRIHKSYGNHVFYGIWMAEIMIFNDSTNKNLEGILFFIFFMINFI